MRLEDEAAAVCRALSCARVDLSDEKRAQAMIGAALDAAGIAHVRERRLSDRDIVDFLAGGLGIEVKMRGARKQQVYKQLQRYAAHDAIAGLILVTNLSMGLPAEIGDKPCWYVSLGRAWL
ncbi:MAG: hypothetical protein ACK4NA_12650 [Alphaproteobacteria bacterium]